MNRASMGRERMQNIHCLFLHGGSGRVGRGGCLGRVHHHVVNVFGPDNDFRGNVLWLVWRVMLNCL